MKIIGICGFIGSGKDTAAGILKEIYGDRVKHFSFAGALKDAVAAVFGWDRQMIEGATAESRKWRECVDPWWSERLGIPGLTPRYVLQTWGTDLLRNHFHQDIWLASVERKISECGADDIVVITDCRFPNEIRVIQELGGELVWIQRGEMPSWYPKYVLTGEPPIDVHPTEFTWLNSRFDRILENNGSFEDLFNKISDISV